MRGVVIQIPMIEATHDLPLQQIVQILQIQDHTGDRIGFPADGDLQPVVVPVPGGAASEAPAILLLGEIGAAVAERG